MKRRIVIGGVAAAALAAAGGAAWKLRLFRKHYPPTPYDDLLNQIVDRDAAIQLGQAKHLGDDMAAQNLTVQDIARILRQPGHVLATRAPQDALAGDVVEIDGWIIPTTLRLYSLLAAKA